MLIYLVTDTKSDMVLERGLNKDLIESVICVNNINLLINTDFNQEVIKEYCLLSH